MVENMAIESTAGNSTYKQLKITIFNLNRQEILTATNRTELDISHFPKGLYFIKLKIDNKIIDKKFIIVE
jgi:hypothetical protein